MPVTPNPYDTRLQLTYQVGLDANGNPIEKTKTYARVKPAATDQDMYDVGQSLASLQSNTLLGTDRSDKAALVNTI